MYVGCQIMLKIFANFKYRHFRSANINYATEIRLRSQQVISGKKFQFKSKTKQLKPSPQKIRCAPWKAKLICKIRKSLESNLNYVKISKPKSE